MRGGDSTQAKGGAQCPEVAVSIVHPRCRKDGEADGASSRERGSITAYKFQKAQRLN